MPMVLRMGATENEGKFIDAISKHLKLKAGSMNFPSIERFKRDCALYLTPTKSTYPKEGFDLHKSVGYKKSRMTPVEEDKQLLLTEINTHGFDFLFPQNTHDKVKLFLLTITLHKN
mmetsp:Transcript_1846/g.1988  ORF Transcript_1846/g.1988 Transcript_1846/m.1988 type:complete len:116 (-) Transcript_1846:734-1081(-)